MGKRRFCFLLIALFAVLVLSGCQESTESKYNRAQKLLTESKYDDAIKLFDEISTYEDSSKMSMYVKAVAAGENRDFSIAIKGFEALGEYKDCPMMITYYTARQYESQASDDNWSSRILAAETYDTIALFRDSRERAENNRKIVYEKAVSYAETKQYAQSMEMLAALKDYEDSPQLRRYYEAFDLEQQNKFTEASRCFTALEDYKDSKDQSAEVLQRGYQAADAQERVGKQEVAYEIFMNLAEAEYEDSFERANKPYYDLGMSLREKGNFVDAIAAFEHAGTYSDAEKQVKETKYMQALAKREQQNWDAAIEIFTALDDYKDSTTVQINETNYQRADALEKKGDQEAAYKIWMDLGRYGDSFTRANKPYYELGVSLREEEKWDDAVAAFEHAGLYEDAAKQILETRYAEGEAKRAAQDWDGAIELFTSLGDYKDSMTVQIDETNYQRADALEKKGDQEAAYKLFMSLEEYKDSYARANKPYYDLGISLREKGKWEESIAAFDHAGSYEDVKEQKKITWYCEGEAKLSAKDWDGAASAFALARPYKDAQERVHETRYIEGEAKRAVKDWDGALQAFRSAAVGPYKDAETQITETLYQQSMMYLENSDLRNAARILIDIKDYKDVNSLIDNNAEISKAVSLEEKVRPYKVKRSVLKFGRYEQDADLTNGPEAIEWFVFDTKDDEVLLLSKYCLEKKRFNESWSSGVRWSDCDLRKWLRSEFYTNAFSEQEKECVVLTTLDNSEEEKGASEKWYNCEDTEDRVFLLRYSDLVDLCLRNDELAFGVATEYAIQQRISNENWKSNPHEGHVSWWLRSTSWDGACGIGNYVCFPSTYEITHAGFYVRPAIWINIYDAADLIAD